MKTFEFAFAVHLAEMLLRHTAKHYKRTPYHFRRPIAASMMLATLQSVRNDESFQLFWDKLSVSVSYFD